MKKAKLVLVRHGQSVYNLQNRFTGWTDVELSDQGVREAQDVGKILKKHQIYPDLCFTSWLKRAIHTAELALRELSWEQIDVKRSYKLNERHYGDWQCKDKESVKKEVGDTQFLAVRRGYDVAPPLLPTEDSRVPWLEKKYSDIDHNILPLAESLADTKVRVVSYFKEAIEPELQNQQTLFVSAHGNSLRALVMHLEKISKEEVVNLEIPTGEILVYTFDASIQIVKKEVLL